MAQLGLVVRTEVPEAVMLGQKVINWAGENGHAVVVGKNAGETLKGKYTTAECEKIARECDPVVTLGGDGTLIGVARYVNGLSPVMLGVNFGRLGFLTEIAPEELLATLKKAMSGNVKLGERSMLSCTISRDGKNFYSSQAVNDVVVHKGALDKLMDVDMEVCGEKVTRFRADGLIIATPTGSTAYSLSAGGSIIFPKLSVMIVTPLCSHSLTNRPLILDLEDTVKVSVPAYEGEIYLSIDGQTGCAIRVGDEIEIKKSENKVTFVRSPSKSYFEILREKFGWGAPLA